MRITFELYTERDEQAEVMQKLTDLVKHMKELQFRIESVGCESEMKKVDLQSYLDAFAETNQMISNILKKVQHTQDEIIKHIK